MEENEASLMGVMSMADAMATEVSAIPPEVAAPAAEAPTDPAPTPEVTPAPAAVAIPFNQSDVLCEAHDNETDGHCTIVISMADGRKLTAWVPRTTDLHADQAAAKALAIA